MVPSGNPGITVIEEEEKEPLLLSSLGAGDCMPAASFLHFRFQEVTVDYAAVDCRLRRFLVTGSIVPTDEMPATAGYISVGSGNWRTPVFVDADSAVDTVASLKPILRTEKSPKAEVKVWCHSGKCRCL